jgi:hypothetical protein
VGTFPWFRPKFVQARLDAATLMKAAVKDWQNDWELLYAKRQTPSLD